MLLVTDDDEESVRLFVAVHKYPSGTCELILRILWGWRGVSTSRML